MNYWTQALLAALAAMLPIWALYTEVFSASQGTALMMMAISFPLIFLEMYVLLRMFDAITDGTKKEERS